MNTKNKAQELVNKFLNIKSTKMSDYSKIEFNTAKECAKISINDTLKALFSAKDSDEIYNFYLEVKIELDNL